MSRAFPVPSGRARFDALLAQLITARDKVIAHADGSEFGVHHSPTMVISDSHMESLRRVDTAFWLEAARRLQDEVQTRMRTLRVDSSVIG